MALEKAKLEQIIRDAFPDSEFDLIDYAGDEDHYELKITHASFKGLSKLQQHQKVYKALSGYVGEQLHAISIKTSFQGNRRRV